MNKREIVFALNGIEKIVIENDIPVSEMDCCCQANIYFVTSGHSYMMANDSVFSVRDHLEDFVVILERALAHDLLLPDFIIQERGKKKDIGYFFNEYRSGALHNLPIDEEGAWFGNRYMVGGVGVAMWLYNDSNGVIMFKITPSFQKNCKDFCSDMAAAACFEEYRAWMKNYEPLLVREIPQRTALQWLDQARAILKLIEENTKKRYQYLLK